MGDECIQYQSESGYYHTNILIVDNIGNVPKDDEKRNESELFPIILRFSRKLFLCDIGYPRKVWITKETVVQELVDQFLTDTDKKLLEFVSASSKSSELGLNDNIYENMKDER